MKEKIDKNILHRIEQLEKQYPIVNFDTKEYIKNIITELEAVLQYPIRDRIKLPKEKYFNIDTLYSNIFHFLSTEELRKIAYHNEIDKTN